MRLRRILPGALLVAGLVLVVANGRGLALDGIQLYRATLAPLAEAAGARCRFEPTCSRYAEIVIGRDGALAGGWQAIWRIARCHPWTPPGTADEP